MIQPTNLHGLDLGLDEVEDESLVGLDVLVHAAQLAEGATVLPGVKFNTYFRIGIQLCRKLSQKQICSRSVVNSRGKVNKF